MTAAAPPRRPAPGPGAGRWLRRNLFRTPIDGFLTAVFGALSLYLAARFAVFVFVNARWEIIKVNLKLLLVGRWPSEELAALTASLTVTALWAGAVAGLVAGRRLGVAASAEEGATAVERVSDLVRRFGLIVAAVLLLLLLTDTAGPWLTALAMLAASQAGYWAGRRAGARRLGPWAARSLGFALLAVPVAVFFYMTSVHPLAEWGGFMFAVNSAAAGIVLSFPLGVLLALGRRSRLPLLKMTSIAYIEFVRGSPLFVLLLLANVSLEFFVPAALAPSKVIRAVVTFTVFTAAYIAEIVRGGLQSVPQGQEEAAKALGLSPQKQVFLIVLPQALRNVIPAQIGQFIALFKDTTLAGAALGVLDLLKVSTAVNQQEAFRGQGLIIETLVFVSFLFWVGSFTMSRESQRLERRLGVGTR